MKLLIIEDDTEILGPLSLALKTINAVFDIAQDGEQGCFLALLNDYDLIILDYNLPKLNGKEIIKKLRNDGKNTPIIVTSVRSELDDRIDLLDLGADDYLVKPFSFSELLARIKTILRRPKNIKENIIKMGDLEVDCDKFTLKKGGQRIFLSAKEFALLDYLIKRKGKVISRQEIMEHIWDENIDPFSNTVEVHIMNLRKKIETEGERLIFNFSNRGYKIDTEK